MQSVTSKLRQLVGKARGGSRTYVQSISVDLSPETQERIGQVFGILTASTDGKTGDAFIAHIEDALVRGINEGLLRKDAAPDRIFEGAIARVNTALAKLIDERMLPLDPFTVHSVLVQQRGGDVVMATWGAPQVLLFHVSDRRPAGRIYDLLASEDGDEAAAQPANGLVRGFDNIIAGHIGERDRLLISTHDVTAFVTQDALRSVVLSGGPDAASARLQEQLARASTSFSAAILLVDAEHGGVRDNALHHDRELTATQHSMENLLGTASKTSEIMSPPMLSTLLRRVSDSVRGAAEAIKASVVEEVTTVEDGMFRDRENVGKGESEEGSSEQEAGLIDDATLRRSDSATSAQADVVEADALLTAEPLAPVAATETPAVHVTRTVEIEKHPHADGGEHTSILEDLMVRVEAPVSKAAVPAAIPAARPTPAVPRRDQPRSPVPATPEGTAGGAGRFGGRPWLRRNPFQSLGKHAGELTSDAVHNFNALAPKRRMLLLGAMALVLLLNHSVALADWSRMSAASAAAHSKRIATIEQKLDSAEASIIYRDEARARTLLSEAALLVEELPGRSSEDAATRERLQGLIAAKLDALRHAVRLGAPEVVAAITTADGSPELARMTLRQGTAWSVGRDGAVLAVNTKDGAVREVGDAAPEPTVFAQASNGLVVGTVADLMRFPYASGDGTRLALAKGEDSMTITDADTYGSRLYVLDAPHNRILKHDGTSAGFGAPSVYVKDGTDLANAVAMAIDGSVYVAMRDGTIVQFLSGTRQEFAVQKVDPAVAAPQRLRLTETAIYLLDHSNPARILQFNKSTGVLTRQFESDALNPVTDFSVDETAQMIYAVAGNQVLRFAIPKAE